MPCLTKYDLHASLGYQLSITARLNEKGFEEALKTLSMSRTTWCVLLALEVEALSKPSDIAHFIGIDRTAISRALRHMEKDRLISRGIGPRDGRTTQVAITEKGRDLLARATPHAATNADLFDQRLTAEERQHLLGLLAKLRGAAALSLNRI